MYIEAEAQMLVAFIAMRSPVPGGSSTSTTVTPPASLRTAFIAAP